MKPEKLTIKHVEKHLDLKADQWHGHCAVIARAACELVGGSEIYGDYLGPIAETGHWAGRRHLGATHHGWVLLEDGRILDPTRWSFEDVKPYIYLNHNDKDYDEGGNKMRKAFRRACPPPGVGRLAKLKDHAASPLLEHLTKTPYSKTTVDQIFWVANLGYDELDFAVGPIYQCLLENGFNAAIPMDNLRRARREKRII